MTMRKLSDIAKTIRSKNAGIDKITFDVILASAALTMLSIALATFTRETAWICV